MQGYPAFLSRVSETLIQQFAQRVGLLAENRMDFLAENNHA